MNIGVLALQGDFDAHFRAVSHIGARAIEVKRAEEVTSVDGLVLPGGESSAMLRLLEPDLQEALSSTILSGTPTLATCAGLILLAKNVSNPSQDSLGLLDIDAERNGYGRQVDSFVEPALELTSDGKNAFNNDRSIEAVFIRAPIITRTGDTVITLASCREMPVLVQQGNLLGATFHPELASKPSPVYSYFAKLF